METQYRSLAYIEKNEADDPILHSARLILDAGIMNADEILGLYESVRARVRAEGEIAITRPKLSTREAVESAVIPTKPLHRALPPLASEEGREKSFGNDWSHRERPYHMAKLINWALRDLLLQYPATVVFGEDVAQKGGVYNVTSGLAQSFGPRRVFNTLLDETSILGTAIGFAHNGFLPIPEIQFLAYFHNAEDQLRGEAATLSFFSQGQYLNPMVVRVAGLAYQKGFGGHFHNDNSLAVFRDIPGVIIACPSNGRDAALMLRRAVREAYLFGRIVIFVEPIALYMTKDLLSAGDNLWSFPYPDPGQDIKLGDFSVFGESSELAIVTYGNGYYLSRQAAADMKLKTGQELKIIDLRWLAPIDEARLAAELKGTKNILVVDECRRSGSQSEGIVTLLTERLSNTGVRIERITASDCFIPLGKSSTISLPSREEIFSRALSMLSK
jgi:2-oxoisovalerate dehydrogenase E1 component